MSKQLRKVIKEWEKWNDGVVKTKHGDIYFYRNLYEGKHSEVFPRAEQLIKEGEIVDNIYDGRTKARMRTPYLVANFCKLICEVPADMVSRAIGEITPSGLDDLEPGLGEEYEELLNNIVELSNLEREHWTNILQQQLDGGLVGVPWKDEDGTFIETKSREVYFPHNDGKGVDLAYKREFDEKEDEEFLHVYRERVEQGDLTTEHKLFRIENNNKLTELDEQEAMELLKMDYLKAEYSGRNKPFIVYWANDKTFMNPLGSSVLKNQGSKQDEINWVLTRNAIIYERNGKPRIAVSKEIFRALQEKALDKYGDESKIDSRDLEVVTFNEEGKAMEVIQIDIDKIGDVEWVKDLARMMFYETKTSGSAVDFEDEHGSGNPQSGVAKFYDLFVSIVKAEKLAEEYVKFLQELLENCLWLEHLENEEIPVEKPEIALRDIIPTSRQELVETEAEAFEKNIQSLYETVKRLKPRDCPERINEEVELIKEEQVEDTIGTDEGREAIDRLMDREEEV